MSSRTINRRGYVMVVVPVFTHVEPGPFGNFLCMMLRAHESGRKFDVMVPERKILHTGMNEVGDIVLQHGHDGVIVFDDDCFPPYDAIPRLVAHADAGEDFVAGVGVMRNFPHTTTVGKYFDEGISLVETRNGHEFRGFEWLDRIDRYPKGLLEVDFCGMPVAWISRKVFETIDPPWFGTHINGGSVTHDVYFAQKLKDAGFTPKVDTTMLCDHLGPAPRVTFANRDFARRVLEGVQQGVRNANESIQQPVPV